MNREKHFILHRAMNILIRKIFWKKKMWNLEVLLISTVESLVQEHPNLFWAAAIAGRELFLRS